MAWCCWCWCCSKLWAVSYYCLQCCGIDLAKCFSVRWLRKWWWAYWITVITLNKLFISFIPSAKWICANVRPFRSIPKRANRVYIMRSFSLHVNPLELTHRMTHLIKSERNKYTHTNRSTAAINHLTLIQLIKTSIENRFFLSSSSMQFVPNSITIRYKNS